MIVLCTSIIMRPHRERTGGAHVSHALESSGYCLCAVHVPTNANVPYDSSDYIYFTNATKTQVRVQSVDRF